MDTSKPIQTWQTASPEQTRSVARELVDDWTIPRVVGLVGPLGSGKTTFVRGVVEACGGVEEPVRSPTFTLLNQYETSPPVYHADLYRTSSWSQQETIGLEEYFDGGIILVEWAARWQGRWPDDAGWMEFEYVDEKTRSVRYYQPRPTHEQRLAGEESEVR